MRSAFILAAILFVPATAFSATIIVPDDYPTIQQAIDAATNRDTVVVKPGTYVENIDFKGKAITVISEQGADVTVIDGNQAWTVVTFKSGEGADSVLEGFTVTNGQGGGSFPNYRGAGINCTNSSSPTITNNCLVRNTSPNAGGGIACTDYSDAIITNNTITQNTADDGGGIYGDDCFLTILNNTIVENSATSYGGGGIYGYYVGAIVMNNVIMGNTASIRGGGMAVLEATHTPYPIWEIRNNIIANNSAGSKGGGINIQCSFPAPGHNIINNTITGNTAVSGGGIALCLSAYPVITNTILWDNSAPEIHIDSGGGDPNVTYSNIMGGWPGVGNIDKDPLFVDPANGDCHLTYLSPCRNTGDNTAVTEFTDFEGDPRICHGTVDMGADECFRHLYCTGDTTPGGSVELKFIDLPGASPVGLWIALNALETPIPGAYGDWWLLPPMVGPFSLPPIPSNGVYVLPGTIPTSPPGPYTLYLQAIMGTPMKLTNLCTMNVQ